MFESFLIRFQRMYLFCIIAGQESFFYHCSSTFQLILLPLLLLLLLQLLLPQYNWPTAQQMVLHFSKMLEYVKDTLTLHHLLEEWYSCSVSLLLEVLSMFTVDHKEMLITGCFRTYSIPVCCQL